MTVASYKLGHLMDGIWQELVHPPVFRDSSSREANPRIEAALPHGDPGIFSELAECMSEPYVVLYVLHTPRGEGESGRYQSPSLDGQELRNFLERFGNYLSSDSRFDIWIHSSTDQATLVWDRHNLIFAYGICEKFMDCFRDLGFSEGDPSMSVPHEHYYRKEFDHDAAEILGIWDWKFSKLRAEDEQ